MNRYLVTGGAGFIGSNLVHHLIRSDDSAELLNLDALTYAGNPENVQEVADHERYRFVQGDISDREIVRDVLNDFRPTGIFHLAAETHVDNSIASSSPFVASNVIGTYNLLQEARELWSQGASGRFLHVSTDEVYGDLPDSGLFTEDSQYRPNSPYSATKAASDHLVRAWGHTYGLDVVTTNCSNNYGPRQHPEKLIPTVISAALAGDEIPVYGKGSNVRDWLYVEDHCAALEAVFRRGTSGRTYLIGARNEWRNIDLVQKICHVLDSMVGKSGSDGYAAQIAFVTDRPGHDRRYALDPTRMESEIGWKATVSFDDGLERTVRWYVNRFTNKFDSNA